MNILIIGEYSSFAKHLKGGFKKLGHTVWIVQNGDSFKKIKGDNDDIFYRSKNISICGKRIKGSHYLRTPFDLSLARKRVEDLPFLDIIIILNYKFLAKDIFHSGILFSFVERRKKTGSKIIMSCCGDDPAFYYNAKYGEVKYVEEFFGCRKADIPFRKVKLFDRLIAICDVIIPTAFDYSSSIKEYCKKYAPNQLIKITKTIPLPITRTEFIQNSCVGRKIVIYHGIIREQCKGSSFFIQALGKLSEKYNDAVEVHIVKRIPYDTYIKLFEKMDILLDQTNSYGIGMNATLGLMNGKVVFSGNEPENERELNVGRSPVINATPSVDEIYDKLEFLVNNPNEIERIKIESRLYAEANLDSEIIAQRYLVSVK